MFLDFFPEFGDEKWMSLAVLAMLMIFVGNRLTKVLGNKYRGKASYSGRRDSAGRYHGNGKLICNSGNVYTGQFVHGKFHGEGMYQFSQALGGGCYEGCFRQGQYHGKGRETYSDGTFYEGYFDNGKRTHRGRMTYPDGCWYDGFWRHGKKHGRGVATLPNGDRFEGTFFQGKRHGRGVRRDKDGNKTLELWDLGEKKNQGPPSVEEKKEGKGEGKEKGSKRLINS